MSEKAALGFSLAKLERFCCVDHPALHGFVRMGEHWPRAGKGRLRRPAIREGNIRSVSYPTGATLDCRPTMPLDIAMSA